MDNNAFTILFGAIGAISILLSAIATWRTTKPNSLMSDSIAAQNYQKTLVEAQKEMEGMRQEIKLLSSRLDNSHLDVTLSVIIGEKPEIKSYEWRESKIQPEVV